MNRAAMNELIRNELEKIPYGVAKDRQNRSLRKLRYFYVMRRNECLYEDPQQSLQNRFVRR